VNEKIRYSTTARFSRRLALTAFSLIVGLYFFASAPHVSAHPIRSSFAEADYHPETKKLEVALRVFPDDLETALSARAGRPISLARTAPPTFDLALLAYLRATFLLRAADDSVPVLHLVGREMKDHDPHLWIYFECQIPGDFTGVRLSHRVLREAFPEQLNALRLGQKGKILLFLNNTEQPLTPP
jgi:hypothetical protein